MIKKTVDGGTTWIDLLNEPEYTLNAILFTDDNTGYVVGQTLAGGIILKTTDAGTTWTPYTTTESGLLSILFIDQNTGYVAGASNLYKTMDGAITWIEIETNFNCNSIYFTNANTGYAVGGQTYPEYQYGYISKTIDGGLTWVTILCAIWVWNKCRCPICSFFGC